MQPIEMKELHLLQLALQLLRTLKIVCIKVSKQVVGHKNQGTKVLTLQHKFNEKAKSQAKAKMFA